MRTVRLGRAFDAVLVHDAVDYMTTEAELGQVIETAFVHCRPGGIAVFVPDHVAETFQAASGGGGSGDATGGMPASASGRGIRIRPIPGSRPNTSSCCGPRTARRR